MLQISDWQQRQSYPIHVFYKSVSDKTSGSIGLSLEKCPNTPVKIHIVQYGSFPLSPVGKAIYHIFFSCQEELSKQKIRKLKDAKIRADLILAKLNKLKAFL